MQLGGSGQRPVKRECLDNVGERDRSPSLVLIGANLAHLTCAISHQCVAASRPVTSGLADKIRPYERPAAIESTSTTARRSLKLDRRQWGPICEFVPLVGGDK